MTNPGYELAQAALNAFSSSPIAYLKTILPSSSLDLGIMNLKYVTH